MKALVYQGPGALVHTEVDDPVPAEGEVVVEIAAAGVCGTDHHIVAGDFGVAPGTIPGHEIAGRIVEVGPQVDGWQPGTRVTSFGQASCGVCAACVAGHVNRCSSPQVLGMARPGGFAERVALPATGLVALPDSIDDAVGAIAPDAIATPFHALVTIGRLRAGETVVVVGAGGLGIHAVLIARAAGAARIVAVDPSAAAREAALAAGADVAVDPTAEENPRRTVRAAARGASLAIECVGLAESSELAIGVLAPGGRAVIVGAGADRPRLPPTGQLITSEISVHGSFGSTPSEIRTVVDLVASGRIDTSRSIGREVPLADGAAVFTQPPAAARTALRP